jgi:hypothetical protein
MDSLHKLTAVVLTADDDDDYSYIILSSLSLFQPYATESKTLWFQQMFSHFCIILGLKIVLSFPLFMPQNFEFKVTIELSGGYEFTQRENSFYNERHSL